eukprot:scaffold45666_cov18-Tisochrysis_lutea.AAC.2
MHPVVKEATDACNWVICLPPACLKRICHGAARSAACVSRGTSKLRTCHRASCSATCAARST